LPTLRRAERRLLSFCNAKWPRKGKNGDFPYGGRRAAYGGEATGRKAGKAQGMAGQIIERGNKQPTS